MSAVDILARKHWTFSRIVSAVFSFDFSAATACNAVTEKIYVNQPSHTLWNREIQGFSAVCGASKVCAKGEQILDVNLIVSSIPDFYDRKWCRSHGHPLECSRFSVNSRIAGHSLSVNKSLCMPSMTHRFVHCLRVVSIFAWQLRDNSQNTHNAFAHSNGYD